MFMRSHVMLRPCLHCSLCLFMHVHNMFYHRIPWDSYLSSAFPIQSGIQPDAATVTSSSCVVAPTCHQLPQKHGTLGTMVFMLQACFVSFESGMPPAVFQKVCSCKRGFRNGALIACFLQYCSAPSGLRCPSNTPGYFRLLLWFQDAQPYP